MLPIHLLMTVGLVVPVLLTTITIAVLTRATVVAQTSSSDRT